MDFGVPELTTDRNCVHLAIEAEKVRSSNPIKSLCATDFNERILRDERNSCPDSMGLA